MAKHDVSLQISHEIPIGNKDVEFTVFADSKPLGRIQISRGSIDWIPSPNSKSGFSVSWEEFAALMEEHG